MNSNQTKLEQELRGMICDLSGLPCDFDPNGNLYLDLGVASMHALQLMLQIEERYGIALPDESFVEAVTLNSMTVLIQNLLSQKSSEV